MTTGELIREYRKAAGLTQKELGARSGIAEPTIRKYESNRLNPKIETLYKIAKALNCKISDLDEGLLKAYEDAFESANPGITEKLSKTAKDAMIDLYGTTDIVEAHKIVFERWVKGLSKNDQDSVFSVLKSLQKLNSDGKFVASERVEELTQVKKYQMSPDK